MGKLFDKAVDLLAFIDISRKNVERALAADNYYSAAFIAEEMAREVTALAEACNKCGRARAKGERVR